MKWERERVKEHCGKFESDTHIIIYLDVSLIKRALLLVFGCTIILGYKEVISRGLTYLLTPNYRSVLSIRPQGYIDVSHSRFRIVRRVHRNRVFSLL